MTGEQGNEGKKLPPRKLGRGLDALLSVPVEIALPGVSRSRTETSGGSAHASPSTASPVASSPIQSQGAVSDVPRGTVPQEHRATVTSTREAAVMGPGLVDLPVDQLRPNARQPRQDFDSASIDALAASIRVAGLMQPIVVRSASDGTFEIIAGERRWRAAQRIGLLTIPAVIRDVDDRTAAEWALIENIQREDLNPMERATALRRLAEEFSLTHQELGGRVGLDRTSVSNLLRLADLDPFCADAVRKGKLSQGHAKALLGVERLDHRQTLAAAAISGEWSVRELERRVQQTLRHIEPSPSLSPGATVVKSSAHLEDLERRLSEHLGSRVTIQLGRKKGSGRLCVDFFSLDQFDGILAKLGFQDHA